MYTLKTTKRPLMSLIKTRLKTSRLVESLINTPSKKQQEFLLNHSAFTLRHLGCSLFLCLSVIQHFTLLKIDEKYFYVWQKSIEFLCTVKSKCMDSRERFRVQGMLRVSSVCELVGFWRIKLLPAPSRKESHLFHSEVQNESCIICTSLQAKGLGGRKSMYSILGTSITHYFFRGFVQTLIH